MAQFSLPPPPPFHQGTFTLWGYTVCFWQAFAFSINIFYRFAYINFLILQKHTSRQGSKPLKVQVIHNSIVSHQTFAQKLLPWLQQITNYAGLYRMS